MVESLGMQLPQETIKTNEAEVIVGLQRIRNTFLYSIITLSLVRQALFFFLKNNKSKNARNFVNFCTVSHLKEETKMMCAIAQEPSFFKRTKKLAR